MIFVMVIEELRQLAGELVEVIIKWGPLVKERV
jgi:hypothetical protein